MDIGGTFTDVVAVSDGTVRFDKAFTTPGNLELGVVEGLDRLMPIEQGPDWLKTADAVLHGTTVSTNALIERRGARVGLVTTRGFEDTLAIARGPIGRTGGLPPSRAMDFVYTDPPPPLVAREDIAALDERVTASGEILIPLQKDAVRTALKRLLDAGVQSLAVVFLWAFRNPANERLVREVAQELNPDLPVSLSSEIAPHIGEFERMVTTVVNAYVAPLTTRYLNSLGERLNERGYSRALAVMTAAGGVILPGEVDARAVSLINSGPVGGLIAARHLGRQLGMEDLITADMGGTSFDVGVIAQGRFAVDSNPFLDHGLPSRLSALKIVTVGAGGGSIARTDGHRLYVGPQSAGSVPGPACYDRGGEDPTVTDALVAMGIVNPERFFGGRRQLKRDRAIAAIQSRVAEPLGLDVFEAAAGIYQVVTAKMADLIRKASVEQGHDPRKFSLCAYGGAAGAHAASLIDQLGILSAMIPYAAPVFSAYGIALSDVLYRETRSVPMALVPDDATYEAVTGTFSELTRRLQESMRASSLDWAGVIVTFETELRYGGQMNAVAVRWNPEVEGAEAITALRGAFEERYRQQFGAGSTREGAPMEIIGFRAQALYPTPAPPLAQIPAPSSAPPDETRPVYLRQSGWVDARIVPFDALPCNFAVTGPAVIERRDTTVWVGPGHRAVRDAYGNIRVTRDAEKGEA